MGFLGFANVYAMRVNLSVAVVAMVNHTAIPEVNGTVLDVCPMVPDSNSTLPAVNKTYLNSVKFGLIYIGNKYAYSVKVISIGMRRPKALCSVRSSMATCLPKSLADAWPKCLEANTYTALVC